VAGLVAWFFFNKKKIYIFNNLNIYIFCDVNQIDDNPQEEELAKIWLSTTSECRKI
jgi:hypothetical protein